MTIIHAIDEDMMTRFEALQEERRKAHRAAAEATWSRLRADLDELGVAYRLFGSFCRGDFLDHSDIDLMILGDLDAGMRQRVRRAAIAAQKEHDVPIDMHFARDLKPETCEALLEH